MANILYFPQCSMYDKTTKELLPEADGNINMLRNTILEWKKHRPNDMFYVLLPIELEGEKAFSVLPAGTPNANPIFYSSYVVSARINRFNFPMNEFSSILRDIKIDLLISDVIELTGNFKQLFKIEFGYEPKIMSNIRHLDNSINYSYMYRVIDGIIQSDITTILSESMKNKLYEQIEDLTNYNIANELFDKVKVFEPSISQAEIDKYLMNAKIVDLCKVIITFPGRLSYGEERRTNWDKFQKAILKLRKIRQDFEVYFTDPNNSMTQELKDSFVDWVYTIPKDRSQFLNLLNKTDIIVSLMDVEGFGGISIREGLLMGCRPIIPYVHEYKKMSPNKDYPGFVSSPINVDDLVESLNKSIKFGKKNFYGDNWKNMGKQFSIEEQFKKLLPKIEEML